MIPLPSGTTYGFDREGKKVCTGSQMGRRNELPPDAETRDIKLSMVRLYLQDECYDYKGAYWGQPDNLYYASAHYTSPFPGSPGICRVFVRADDRAIAKAEVRKFLPKARFNR